MGKGRKSFGLANVGEAIEFAKRVFENLEKERSEKARMASWAEGFLSFVSSVGDCGSEEEIEFKVEILGIGISDQEGVAGLVGKYPEYLDEILWRRLVQACVSSFEGGARPGGFAAHGGRSKEVTLDWQAVPALLSYVSSRRFGWFSSNARSKLRRLFGETLKHRSREEELVSFLRQLDCFAVKPRTGVSGK